MKEHTGTFVAYDTLCSVRIFSDADCRPLVEGVQERALQVQSALNMYDPDSQLSRLCRESRPGQETAVSPLLMDFLTWNQLFYQETAGAFDPTVGPLVRLWDFLADEPKIPTDDAIARELSRVGFGHVRLHPERSAVSFDRAGIVIDPGASGKGYALKLAANYLRENGVTHAVLDFGGNMYAIGPKPLTKGPWRVALRDPDRPDDYMGTILLEDCGIATSSWYEHSFVREGRVYHHLIDPRTGRPKPLTLKSVSILSSDGAFTDFLSTAVFMLGEAEGTALVERIREKSGERIDYVLVREDGSVACSNHVYKPREK